MRRLLLFSLALGLVAPTHASPKMYEGAVVDESHKGWKTGFSALQQTVSGTVRGPEGPVSGATVSVVGSAARTAMDGEGRFSISAEVGSTLSFPFSGLETQASVVTGSTVNVTLEESSS